MILKIVKLLRDVPEAGAGKGRTMTAIFDNGSYGVRLDGKLYWVASADVTVIPDE